MNIMRQHSKEAMDDPFAAISTEIDQENNQLVPPTEFGSGIAKPTSEDSTESTEDLSTHRAEDDDVIPPSKDATAAAPPAKDAVAGTEEQ